MGTFFNPFESQKGGGGGGGGDSSTYSVRKIVDSITEQVSYRLTKTTNGSTIDVGEVIAFTGDEVLVDYDGQTILLNAAVENLKELAEQGKQEVTFNSLEIDTHNKTISQLSAELAAKNLEEGTVVTGRVYSEALPYNNYGNVEVLVNNSIFWWKTSSSTISPYSWNAIVVGNTVKMDWTPTYYQLPIASAQSLGGVKIGNNVQIAPDGTISVITTKGDTGTGIASIAKTSSSGLNDIYTITYTDSTTSTFTVTNGATITGGSIGQTGHLILTMSDGRTIDAGALPTDNEVEVTTTSSQPADPNVELWVDLSTQQTLSIPEINDSSTSSTQDTWSCKKIYDEQQKQEEEIGAVANAGAKNLLKIDKSQIKSSLWNTDWTWSGDTASNDNASVTINQDNTFTVTVSNTMASQVIFDIYLSNDDVSNVILSGCPSGGSSSTHFMYVKGTSYYDTGNGVTFSKTGPFRIAIVVASGHAAGTYIFKPMIRLASITDPTFQPYALPNPTLTPAVIKAVDEGAKNVAQTNDVTKIGDGSVNTDPISGDLFVSAATVSTTASSSTFAIVFYYTDGTISPTQQLPITNPLVYEFNTGEKVVKKVRIFAGNTAEASSGKTITLTNFMICTVQGWAVSHKFVPYCPTLYELYQMVLDLQSGTRSLSLCTPSESLSKGAIDTTAEVEKTEQEEEILTKAEVDDDVHTETEGGSS